MKLRALLILLMIVVSLVPVYLLNRYLQKKIQPGQSAARLFLYMLLGFIIVFAYTFLVVLTIRKLFSTE